MAETNSNKLLKIGSLAPDFKLPSVNGFGHVHLKKIKEISHLKGILLAFICNHCPFVRHLADTFSELAVKYAEEKIYTLAICSNDILHYPDDHPEKMKEEAKKRNYRFPYLYDETQEVAKAYGAACTPDFFLFDKDLSLFYHGQFDDSRPGNFLPVTGKNLIENLEFLLIEKPPLANQIPSIGCNIKWKQGNEPDYFLKH